MRGFFFFLTITLPLFSFSQVTENFSDGDFTINPHWSGDSLEWLVISGQLKSAGSLGTPSIYLSTPSLLAFNTKWEFFANPKLGTTSGNYMDVFLTSDSANLKGNNNGYFVRIGGTSDEVSLFKKQGAVITKIIDGTDGLIASSSNNPTKVRVIRDTSYSWTLEADATGTGNNFALQGTVTDSSFTTSSYFGLLVRYSNANAQKYFFDDVDVSAIYIDTIGPLIDSVRVVSSTELNLYFDEEVNNTSAENVVNYYVNNGIAVPLNATQDNSNPQWIHLAFQDSFTNGWVNKLFVYNMKDTSNNIQPVDSISFIYLAPVIPQFKDILINEIFPDPSPSIDLPDAEFVELYNRSGKMINLEDWKFSDGTTSSTLPSFFLLPNQYLILCHAADTSFYKPFGKVIGKSVFPSLNNSGDQLYLEDDKGLVIDSLKYNVDWYKDPDKDDGGWSLELINPFANLDCPVMFNWAASNNMLGGTPGKINSIFSSAVDTIPPAISSVFAADSFHLEICFSEMVDSSLLKYLLNYAADKGLGNPSYLTQNNPQCATLSFLNPILPDMDYRLIIHQLADCSGNKAFNVEATFVHYILFPQDLLINEVLFDPIGDGVDFVEVYNHSLFKKNLKDLWLATRDDFSNELISLKEISDTSIFIQPKEYKVFTIDPVKVRAQYFTPNPSGIIQLPTLPTYSNDKGTVVLLNKDSIIIDEFSYSSEMHFALLNNIEGVSLERLSPERPTNDKSNWHSAAEPSGFATPAYKNSQSSEIITNGMISLEPELFSPDNDGNNDVLNINYSFGKPGAVASISIFDSKGRLIRKLVQNELLGTAGIFSWDGINESKEKARIGIYVVLFSGYFLSGETFRIKKSCVLGGKL